MALLKSPGPNRFSDCFFQSYWPIVGTDVCKVVLQFLNEGTFDSSLNFTYIILIPKIKNLSLLQTIGPLAPMCDIQVGIKILS